MLIKDYLKEFKYPQSYQKMSDLLQKIEQLERLSEALEPDEDLRNHYLKLTHTFANKFIESLPTADSYSQNKVNNELFEIDGKPHDLDELLDIYETEVTQKGISPASGGHIGYIPGGGLYLSALGDYLADVTNEYAGMYFGGPGAVTMENELLNWLKNIFGFSKESVGNLTSGGSIANLVALTAARDHHGIKNGKVEKAVVYLSAQVHHCIQKAIRIIGLEDLVVREIAIDQNSKIDVIHLKKCIVEDKRKGLQPFLIVASAGTTDTGAIDPLDEIGTIAKNENCWFHIDAAYGGFFILCERVKHQFKGIEKADSLVVDPHKGLFLPYGIGAVLVKNKEAVFKSHHYTANYMQDAFIEGLPTNPADVSPELTKHFRGMRMWLPLKIHGIAPFKACLEEKLHLTTYFREQLIQRGFKVGPEPDLSVSYFWYPKTENELEFNKKLIQEIHKDGRIFLSSSVIQGKQVIRIAVLSFRTKKATIDRCLEMIDCCLERITHSHNISE